MFCGCYRRKEISILFIPENTQLKSSHAAYSKLFVLNILNALQNIWRIMNTIASILHKNNLVYLSLDIIGP